MKIFLIGFMGCGKTTMGRKLAKTLGFEVIDLDFEIELEAGMPVATYFSLNGEEAFRQLESKLLKEFNYPENCVISTGGGTPCFFDNMEWMKNNGETIYLKLPALALAKRLEKGKLKRPLIKDFDEDGLVQFIISKVNERDPFYSQAKYILNGIDLTPEKIKELLRLGE
jgi:shikimate kinase